MVSFETFVSTLFRRKNVQKNRIDDETITFDSMKKVPNNYHRIHIEKRLDAI